VALAQIYGIGIPVVERDSQQFMKLANAARFVKADSIPISHAMRTGVGQMRVAPHRLCP